MRVGFIVSGLGTGGAEFALLRLATALIGFEVQPSVVSLSSAGSIGPLLVARDIPVLALQLSSLADWLNAAPAFRRYLLAERPDILQGWMYHGNLASLALGRIDGVNRPVVWGVRQSLSGTRDKWSTRATIKASALLSTKPAAIVHNSQAGRQQHASADFADDRAAVIPNGFDLDELARASLLRSETRHHLEIRPDELVVGHVARYHSSKDHELFLAAARRISDQCPSTRFVMAGEGVSEDNQRLMSQARALHLVDKVRLLGRTSSAIPLMASFDVLCMSSNGMEGFPNVVAEAMGCGVPCVSTNVGDAHEIIGDTGRVVPPSQPEALAQAVVDLLRLSTSARRALGKAGRRRVEEKYSIASIAERYRNLYSAILLNRA